MMGIAVAFLFRIQLIPLLASLQLEKEGVPSSFDTIHCILLLLISGFVIATILASQCHTALSLVYAGDWIGRAWVLSAGFHCWFRNGLQFIGGEAAGYAAALHILVSRKNTGDRPTSSDTGPCSFVAVTVSNQGFIPVR